MYGFGSEVFSLLLHMKKSRKKEEKKIMKEAKESIRILPHNVDSAVRNDDGHVVSFISK